MKPVFNSPDMIVKAPNGEVTLTLQYVPEKQFIYTRWTWNYWQGIKMVYEGCEAMLKMLEKHSVHAFLNDGRFATDSWDEANNWIANDWNPRAQKAGLKYYSIISSPDFYISLSTNQMVNNTAGFMMHIHPTPEAAIAWLDKHLQ